ncbi:hypothetical protein FUAX_50910 (plasmid) [Fulvitalea axinellae]|uniref:Uncharacterized protein n=1 Tax=Fulvitalea axinellae TaxID=1182444 RepID=A0AAU9CKY1_9BACT|nr:hypothetical protein FUAX_50910 [Fulvitalea axinellae]
MKKLLTLFIITLLALNTFGQSNHFPPGGNVRIGTTYNGSILNILKKPADIEAHLFLGNPESETQSGFVSSRLCFAGTGIQHAGLAWVPDLGNSKGDGKLHLAFGGYQNPMKNSIEVTFQSNGNVGFGTTNPGTSIEIKKVVPLIGINGTAVSGFRGLDYQYNGTTFASQKADAKSG